MSVGDHDLYVMMDVQGSTVMPGGMSSRGPILVTFDDLNPGQVRTTRGGQANITY